jgi:hypothetical protein
MPVSERVCRKLILALLWSGVIVANLGFASAGYCAAASANRIKIEVLHQPNPMIARNRAYLSYELQLTNFDSQPITLKSIQVTSGSNTSYRLSGATLASIVEPIGSPVENPLLVAPGAALLVYLWLEIDPASVAAIGKLEHKITYQIAREQLPRMEDGPPAIIDQTPAIVIGPPLVGGNWAAINGPSLRSSHRRVPIITGGRLFFAQRYAVDFTRIGADGKTFTGDPLKNQSYFSYGAEVLAVADGKVVTVNRNVPDSPPHGGLAAVAVAKTVELAGGNCIVLYIGYDRYALYCHLIPGSITVKPGDLVRRGQALGKVGDSGNSNPPHLHFQVMDGPSPLAASGVPYGFDTIVVRDGSISADHSAVEVNSKPEREFNQLMISNSIVDFP